MSAEEKLLLFLLLVVGGVALETVFARCYFYFHKKPYIKHRFKLSRYFFLLLMPLFAVCVLTFLSGSSLLVIFALFAIVGPIFEWCIDHSYEAVVGQKLWTYHRYAINGNTSLLAVPIWGLGGVLFYLFNQLFK